MTEFATEHAPHIEDIARALNDKLDHPTIAEELRKYVEDYSIDLATAKEAIVRKHYGDPRALARSVTKTLDQLTSPENSVSFRAKLVSLREKQINTRDGERKIHEGYVADATGQLRFTSWHEDFPFEVGAVIEVSNAYSKEWNNNIDINLGDRCRVREVEDEALAALEVEQPRSAGGGTGGGGGDSAAGIIGLRDGMRNVNLTVRVLRVEPREVTVRGEQRTIYGGEVADETGSVRFTDWHGHELTKGRSYKLDNGYVREWQGTPELQLSEYCTVTEAEETGLPSTEVLDVGTPYTIEQLDERGGANDAVLEGHVLAVREGSGLIFRCPECNRMLQSGSCMIHDRQTGKPDLRTKAILDDGTGSLQLILGRETTEQILGYTLEDALDKVKETYSPEVVQEELQDKLVLAPARVTGNITNDDWGLMMIGRSLTVEAAYDAEAEALKFMESLEMDLEVA